MKKGGKERGHSWLSNTFFLILVLMLLIGGVGFLVQRDAAVVSLKYGELKQLLRDPGVAFQNVKVGRTEIRGDIVTRDAASGLSDPATGTEQPEQTRTIAWRTPRMGLEYDQELQKLLDSHVGPGYQGEDEESAFKGVYSLLISTVLLIGMLAGGGSCWSAGCRAAARR